MSHAKDYDAAARFEIPQEFEALLHQLPKDETDDARALIGHGRTLQVRAPNGDLSSLLAVRANQR